MSKFPGGSIIQFNLSSCEAFIGLYACLGTRPLSPIGFTKNPFIIVLRETKNYETKKLLLPLLTGQKSKG